MQEITRHIVSAILVSKDNKIFMGKKDPDKGGVYNNCWHLPGGGIESGEGRNEALIREILEETGIDIKPYKNELVSDDGTGESQKTLADTHEKILVKMKFYVYKVMLPDNAEQIRVILSDDLIQFKWFTQPELKEVELTPPSQQLFKKLGLL